jgi:translation elongation factor EF-G
MLVRWVPSAKAGTMSKVERCYTGPQDSQLAEHMRACNPRGPLVIYVCKLFPKKDCSGFDAFGRVMSGTVKPGDKVRPGWPAGVLAAACSEVWKAEDLPCPLLAGWLVFANRAALAAGAAGAAACELIML